MKRKEAVYKGLEFIDVYFTDTSDTSPNYFQITEFPLRLTAGKNLFKLRGHPANLKVGGVLNFEVLGTSITGLSFFLNTVLSIITTVDLASIVTSVALKTPPASALPTPGVITTLLNDAQTLIRKVTFDQYGNSKLSKYQSVLAGSALILSIIGNYILTAVEALKLIDNVLQTCDPNNTLPPITKSVQSIADAQLQAQQTINQTTYNGFIIEIEEVPYTPTVNRRRAIGKNQQGINLIQTELSFTTDNLTLINELKLIIDRDNLKAY